MAVDDCQVHVAVIVVVEKMRTPADERLGEQREMRARGPIFKWGFAAADKQRVELVVEVRNNKGRMAVAENIGRVNTHSGLGNAVFIEGNFSFIAAIDKSP